MQEIAGCAASKVVDYLVAPVGRHCGYVIYSNSNVRQLKGELGKLDHERQRVQHSIDEARKNMKQIEADVEKWMEEENTIANNAHDVLDYDGRAKKTCFYGWLPNPKERYCLGRDARKTVLAIQALIPQGKFEKVYYESAPPGLVGGASNVNSSACDMGDTTQELIARGQFENPPPGRVGDDGGDTIRELIVRRQFEKVDFENPPPGLVGGAPDVNSSVGHGGDFITDSRAPIFQGIMKALNDEKLKAVGVYGPGGVGKTTLLEIVEKKLRKTGGLFHTIVKVEVSRTPDLTNIQGQIADALGLNLKDKESQQGRRDLLFQRLQSDPNEKILIILDDLWTELNLRAVGIPMADESMGCKLLLTSRDESVLEQKMRADRTFRLEGLKEDEAFRLFEKMVGDKLKDEELKAKAAQVVTKLAGLPLLITSVASTLKCSDMYTWDNALIKIEDPNIDNIVRLSYDHLKNEDAQTLFLLCGLIGGTIKFELLLGLGMGLGLFEGFNNTIQDSRNRLNTMLDRLRFFSLLQDGGDDKENVTIHDLYSEVAVSTLFRGQNSLMMNGNYGSWPKEKLEKCWAIRLTNVGRDRLAELTPCQFPKLEILMLSLIRQQDVGECSRLDFTHMKELRVLYFCFMHITSLLSSIGILENLHSLYLDRCIVKEVAILGNLKALQILSFSGSTICILPKEIGELTNLRSLNLNYCSMLVTIEPGVLKGLTNLEELHMKRSFNRWMGGDELPSELCNAKLAELQSLKKLTSLEISICDPTVLFKDVDLPVENLIKFWITIGNVESCLLNGFGSMALNLERWDNDLGPMALNLEGRDNGLRSMALNLEGCDNILSRGWVQKTLQKTQYLHLDGLREIGKNAHGLCIQLPQVKHLNIQNSSSIKYIASSSKDAFTILESLFLNNLITLEKICHGLVATECFKKLKVVKVKKCIQLKYLWYSSQMQRLVQLEEIEVHLCDSMRAIVIDDVGKDIVAAYNKVELPNVRCLKLAKLPNMTSFCVGARITSESAPIQAVAVDEEGRDEGTDDVIDDCPTKKFFSYPHEKKESVTAISDPQDAYSDPFFDRKASLPSLEKLVLDLVGSIQSIWHDELPESSFCKLATISLYRCSDLLHVFPSSIVGRLHNLKNVCIEECPSLKSVFDCESLDSNAEHKIELLPKLEEVRVNGARRLRHVVKSKSQMVLGFPSLKIVNVVNCPDLRYLFPKFTASTLEKLENLQIANCKQMQEVIPKKDGGRLEVEVMSFPCLRSITLDKLNNLICFSFGSCSYDFASLENLNILQCYNIRDFIPSLTSVKRPLGEIVEEDDESLHDSPTKKFFSYPQEKKESVTAISESQDAYSDPFFDQKVSFPSLEKLVLNSIRSIQRIWHDELPSSSLCKLATVSLYDFSDLLHVFPSSIVGRLHNLKNVCIGKCPSLKSVFDCESLDSNAEHKFELLPKLEEVRVNGARRLRHVVKSESQMVLGFPSLKIVNVVNCPDLRYLFPKFTASTLEKLENLQIINCEQMQEVIPKKDGGRLEVEVMSFPCLRSMTLHKLDNLICFSSRSCSYDFASLENLNILWCCNFRVFIPCLTSVKRLLGEIAEEDDELLQPLFNESLHDSPTKKFFSYPQEKKESVTAILDSQDAYSDPFFNQKVSFPSLENLVLNSVRSIQRIWHDELPSSSFCKLATISLYRCSDLLHVFPSSIVGRLHNLKKVCIEECSSLKSVFDCESLDSNVEHKIELLPKLEEVRVDGARRLRHVVKSESQMVLGFPSLKIVNVANCSDLRYLFPKFTASTLEKLENLQIINCEQMQEVIPKKDGGRLEAKVMSFPCLRSMTLDKLDNLICFSSGSCSYDFASLENLNILRCYNFRVFIPCLKSVKRPLGEIVEEDDELLQPLFNELLHDSPTKKFFSYPQEKKESVTAISDSQDAYSDPFFNLKVSFPSLEKLVLNSVRSIQRIWHDELPDSSFYKLATVSLHSCSDLLHVFPSSIVGRLHNLKKVCIEECPSLKLVFDCESLDSNAEHKIELLSKLEKVRVNGARRLRHVVKSKSQMVLGFPSLKIVNVANCPNLRYLFPKFTASTLEKLVNLQIINCEQMQEVIPKKDGDRLEVEVMSFPCLRSVTLDKLNNLICFSSGSCSYEFASLENLNILWCCNFGMFIPSPTSVKRLLGEMAEGDDESLQPLFEMVVFPNLKSLTIEGAPYKNLWNKQIPKDSFSKVKCLSLKHCDDLLQSDGKVEKSSELRSIVLRDLDNLRHIWQYNSLLNGGEIRDIEVEDCRNMKAVIVDEEGRDERIDDIIEFPLLNRLTMKGCPTDKFFSYPHGKKESITTTSDSQHTYSDSFFDQKVSLPSLEKLVLNSMGSFKRIWHGELSRSSFCKLATLTLESCSDLLNVFPSTIIGRLHNLKNVKVSDCPSLKSLFDCGSLDSNTELLLSKIEKVEVNGARKLRHVVKSNSQTALGFPSLKEVSVKNCSGLRYLFPNYTATTLGKLKSLLIDNCKKMKEVTPKEEGGQLNAEVMSFPSLTYLCIFQCPNFEAFLRSPPSVKRQLGKTTKEDDELPQSYFNEMVMFPNLESLKIKGARCKELWNNQIVNDSFCKLEHLELENCDNLLCIAPSHMWKWLQRCLKSLKVISCRSIEIIFESDGKVEKSGELKSLILRNLDNLRHIWQYNSLLNGEEIREIEVVDCRNMKAMIMNEEGTNEEIDDIIEFPLLKRLVIKGCPAEKFFSYPQEKKESVTAIANSQNAYSDSFFNRKVSLPSLEDLVLDSVGSVKRIWYDELPKSSFCNLASLTLESCSNLLNVFPSAIIGRLHNLKIVYVFNCPSLESLFDCGSLDLNEKEKIVLLPKLKQVRLSGARRLRHVVMSSSQMVLGFPDLKDIIVGNCSELRYLFPNYTATTLRKLEGLRIGNCKQMKEVVLKEEGGRPNVEVMSFPCLSEIELSGLDNLICFSSGCCLYDFSSLIRLSIWRCRNLGAFISSPISVERPLGKTIKEDVELPQPLFNEMVTFPNLESLKIRGALCKELWNNEIPNDSFCQLKHLELEDCDNLLCIAPSHMWKGLQHCLETLKVISCHSIEIKFESDGKVKNNGKLRNLVLRDLDNLRHIWQYNGVPNGGEIRDIEVVDCRNMKAVIVEEEGRGEGIDDIIEFPLLERLSIKGCPTEKFFSYSHGKKESITTTSYSQDTYSNSFFDRKVSLPSLELLWLDSVGSFKRIWHDGLPQSSFYKLATLILGNCSNLLDVFPSTIIGRLHNLKTILVSKCASLESLFDCGSLDSNTEHKIVLLPKLEQVSVSGVGRLRHVVTRDSQMVLGFPSLKELWVDNCSDLSYLFPYFTATTLEKLERLQIRNCKQMKEVVPKETAKVDDESQQPLFNETVTFPNIRCLKIEGAQCKELWNKQILNDSFCKLETLELMHCDNLQRIAPSHMWKRLQHCLESLKVRSCRLIEIIYESDGKVAKSGKLSQLALHDLDNLKHIWQYDSLQGVPFPNLRCIETQRCPRLEILFPTFAAKFLRQIEELVVRSCEDMELIAGHEECEEAIGTTITFSKLTAIRLYNLPKFKSFLPEKYRAEFPSLEVFRRVNCGTEPDQGLGDEEESEEENKESEGEDKVL